MLNMLSEINKDKQKQQNGSTIRKSTIKSTAEQLDIFSQDNYNTISLKAFSRKHSGKHRQTLQNISKIVLETVFKSSNFIINRREIISKLNVNRRRVFDVLIITTSIGILFPLNRNQYQFRTLQTLQKIISDHKPYFEQQDSQIKKLSISILKYLIVSQRKVSIQQISYQMHEYFESAQTRGRRIYDVLNVFLAYFLIKKCKQQITYYQWVGIEKLKKFCQSKIKTENDLIKIEQEVYENQNQMFLLQPFVFCLIHQ